MGHGFHVCAIVGGSSTNSIIRLPGLVVVVVGLYNGNKTQTVNSTKNSEATFELPLAPK